MNPDHHFGSAYCILYQEDLCSEAMNALVVVAKIVIFIRARGLSKLQIN